MKLLILFILLTLFFSGLSALLESVLLSVNKAYIALLKKKGKKSGNILTELKIKINNPLAAILTINNISTIIGASVVGAQSYNVFGSKWVAVTSGLLTVLVIIFSEIIPKTIGALYWRKIAPFASYIIKLFMIITFPIVWTLEKISRSISGKNPQSSITRDELMMTAEIAHSEGVLTKKESHIINNLLLLNEIRVEEILTPRTVILAFQKDQTVAEIMRLHEPIPFSRIPVYEKDLDNIIGMVRRREIFRAFFTGKENEKIMSFLHSIHAVPESKTITDLMDEFLSRKEHIFIAIDEYGGTAGLVTLEDAVETLLGIEIVDEYESIADLRAYAKEKWKQRKKDLS